MNEVFNKREAYNQVHHKKKYKNNSTFLLQKTFVKKIIKGPPLCMKMKEDPVKTKKYKSSIDIYQNQQQNQKTSQKHSALIRSSKGFWEETSSLFCYLCLGQWKWKIAGAAASPFLILLFLLQLRLVLLVSSKSVCMSPFISK